MWGLAQYGTGDCYPSFPSDLQSYSSHRRTIGNTLDFFKNRFSHLFRRTSALQTLINSANNSNNGTKRENPNSNAESSAVAWKIVRPEDLCTVYARDVGSHDHQRHC